MTCIVGVEHDDGRVYIGGDSAGVAGYSITSRADAKVFTAGQYVFGFCGSFRAGQLLRYSLKAPTPKGDLDRFMVTTFMDAVRECWDKGGYLTKLNNSEEGGTFLVGVKGSLFCVESDHQVGRTRDGYAAIGCGDDLALGSLHTTRGFAWSPRNRIKRALDAAAYHSAGVTGPYVVKVERKAS